MTKVLLSLLLCAVAALAAFSPEGWRFRRHIVLNKEPAPFSEFTVDSALYRGSAANLDDVRILRQGVETPYLLISLSGQREIVDRPLVLLNKAWVPNAGVQAIIDLKGRTEHNRIRLDTELHNFKETVKLEASDDAKSWAVVRSSALIFDVQRDDHNTSEMTVDYPLSTRRYLRLTIPGWTDPVHLQGVFISSFKETDAVRDALAAVTPTVRENAQAQTTYLIADLGFAGQPFDRIELSVGPGLFSRSVDVATSSDGEHWDSRAGASISRTAEAEHLSIATTELADRYLRIAVFNGDNAPLSFGPVTLRGIRRVIEFPSKEAGPYTLYFGNSGVRAPAYDLVHVLPRHVPAAPATLGPEQENPDYRAPERPWSDRNPWLLNSVLIVAVAAMGLLTFRYLKKLKAS